MALRLRRLWPRRRRRGTVRHRGLGRCSVVLARAARASHGGMVGGGRMLPMYWRHLLFARSRRGSACARGRRQLGRVAASPRAAARGIEPRMASRADASPLLRLASSSSASSASSAASASASASASVSASASTSATASASASSAASSAASPPPLPQPPPPRQVTPRTPSTAASTPRMPPRAAPGGGRLCAVRTWAGAYRRRRAARRRQLGRRKQQLALAPAAEAAAAAAAARQAGQQQQQQQQPKTTSLHASSGVRLACSPRWRWAK